MEYLSNEGLRPQEEDFGIYFKYQLLSFFIHWDDEDASFLSIILPDIFSTDENNRTDALEAINQINENHKVVKCFLCDDRVWISAEQLLDSSPSYASAISSVCARNSGFSGKSAAMSSAVLNHSCPV